MSGEPPPRLPAWLGALTALLGLAMGVLPALPWFEAALPTGPDRISGLSASGELWLMPALGLLVLAMGLLILLGRPPVGSAGARRAGLLVLLAGALGVLWAGRDVLEPPVRVVADRPGAGTAELPDGAVAIDVLLSGWATLAVSALAAACGLLAMRSRG
ncbi:MAG: hypothetical protein MUE51_05350 [Thermoleophilia bacterium]|nr:hypothetical protein [Thermoleophilia bacterium]